jgi:hypothetical protein
MRTRFLTLALGLLGIGALFLSGGPAASQAPPPPAPAEDTEPLARGPVHEAYAEPVDYAPQPGPVVAKKPADPIEELPPDQKPDGADVHWIPGYWAWDAESSDFLWVSGLWRDVPPGHHWVPGAWQEVEGGWQWSPGFWASDETQEVNYIPYPPPPVETAAPPPPANATDVFVPGCWVYRETRYQWRPGYYVAYRPDWIWTPARYVWTPGGCVFIDGYWDHPFEGRGLLFCPVRILRRDLADWTYIPNYVVRADFLLSALFVGPSRHHYFFGDYFTDAYAKRGFVAWIDYRPTKRSWDPIYEHYRSEFHGDQAWDRNLKDLYRGRFAGDIPRPPHTFREQEKVIQGFTANKTANVNVLKNGNITHVQSVSALVPLAKYHEEKVTRLSGLAPGTKVPAVREIKVQQVKKEEIVREKQQIQHVREVTQQRQVHEAKLVTSGTVHLKPAPEPKGAQLVIPKSPVVRPVPTVKPPARPIEPKHEERTVPVHEPPKPPMPPKKAPPPPKKEDKPPVPPKPPEPPKKETPPPPKKEDKPPPPPKKEDKPPPPPKKEDKPPPHVAPAIQKEAPPAPPMRENQPHTSVRTK